MLRKFDEGVRNTADLFEVIRSVSGARIVIDASKDYLKGLALYRLRPSGTRLILLTRDGRGVFYSGLRSGLTRRRALRRWRNYYQNTLPLIASAVPDDHILTVRYEDIAVDTERTLRRICSFLQLDFEPSMLELGTKPAHVANGNGLRLRGDRVVALDHTWHAALTPADRAYFDRHAGALNARLGYGEGDTGKDPGSLHRATLTE
jgi:hypothetical protein